MFSRRPKETTAAFIFMGGFGGHNLGDEAILWALSLQLRSRVPHAKQYVLVRGRLVGDAACQYKSWQIEPVYGLSTKFFFVLRRARLIVGGGQLIDNESLGLYTVLTSLTIIVNWMLGNAPMILFVGAECVTRVFPRVLVKCCYSFAAIVSCRDTESAKALIKAGIQPDKVMITKDVVFSLDRTLVPQFKANSNTVALKIAVVIAYDRRRMRDDGTRAIQLINSLLRAGFIVELIAHDLRTSYDMGALTAVEHSLGCHDRLICHRARSADDAFDIYSRVHAVVSGRMHPLIMAALVGTLPIAFGGREKVRSLASMSKIPELVGSTPSAQVNQICDLLSQRAQMIGNISSVLEAFHDEAVESLVKALAA